MGKNNQNGWEYEKLINSSDIEEVIIKFNYKKQVINSIIVTIEDQKKATDLVIRYTNKDGSPQELKVPIPENDSKWIANYVKVNKEYQNNPSNSSNFRKKMQRTETLCRLYDKAVSFVDKNKEQYKKREDSLPVKNPDSNNQRPITLIKKSNGKDRTVVVYPSNRNYPNLNEKLSQYIKSEGKLKRAETQKNNEKTTIKKLVANLSIIGCTLQKNEHQEHLKNEGNRIVNTVAQTHR
ncbi:hypothetical protein [Enterococcus hirae]|uniref:hypothetical protein n=1 Tax=Enterococcus hirae TaxID=1354 RepID=UPI001A9662F2|nr:hypothetical protein [Enterococcus hirae]MBO1102840.1 hypothetical protein [Enterococcus hirae]